MKLKRLITLGALMLLITSPLSFASEKNAYAFSFEQLTSDQTLDLASLKGKVLLIVNTASECGFTEQYKGLEDLYQTYQKEGLFVIGVPSNDFGKQEPGDADQIASFCEKNFGVSFPMTKKQIVKGSDAHPFYQWAKQEKGALSTPKWNFHKYLIDREGNLADFFLSTTKPDSAKIKKAIQALLSQEIKQEEKSSKTDS